jgi:Acetyltransferase (GNAT) domain
MDVRQTSRFADRVTRLLERVEYRRADSPAEKAAIYRLRHESYMRAGTVEPRPSGMFHDAMDEADNAWLIGLFIDGELASALRLHISASLRAPLPELASFADIIEPHLAAGRTIIDASLFVSSLEFSQKYSEIPYLTLRPTFLAEEFFGANYVIAGCLASIKPSIAGFTARWYGLHQDDIRTSSVQWPWWRTSATSDVKRSTSGTHSINRRRPNRPASSRDPPTSRTGSLRRSAVARSR